MSKGREQKKKNSSFLIQGMILAASHGKTLSVISPEKIDEIPDGTIIS